MSKFKVRMTFGGGSSPRVIGTYNTIEEAAQGGWDYARNNGSIRSNCETEESVKEALLTRQFCMLGYGPDELEVEEVMV